MSTVGICSCAGNFNNLGEGSDCIPLLEAPQNLTFALIKKEDGTDNCVDVTGLLDDAQMKTHYEAEIAHDRFYPLNGIKEYTLESAESVTSESASGATREVRKGRASVTYRFWSNNPSKLAEKLETYKCLSGLGVFITDTAGNDLGKGNAAGNLCPRAIEDNSLIITPSTHSFEDGGFVDIKWTYTIDSGEETIEYILATDFASDVDLLGIDGLEDANISDVVSTSVTEVNFNLTKDFGSLVERLAVKGLDGVTFLELFNESTTTTVPFVTLVRTGINYAGTVATQVDTNVFRIQGKTGLTVQNGFDLKRIPSTTGVITA